MLKLNVEGLLKTDEIILKKKKRTKCRAVSEQMHFLSQVYLKCK